MTDARFFNGGHAPSQRATIRQMSDCAADLHRLAGRLPADVHRDDLIADIRRVQMGISDYLHDAAEDAVVVELRP